MNLDLDDVAFFHLFYYCPNERDWWGINMCLKIRVGPPDVSDLHGWIFLSLLEER